MGDTLFGGEKSGTPVETRQGTQNLANIFSSMMARGTGSGGLNDTFGRMTNEAWVNMLGFNPSEMGLDEAASAALMDPRDMTKGLFSAMRPFEERETNRQVAQQREMFGTMGGRFSRNLGTSEAELRGELSSQFGRNRENALLQATQLRNNALAQLITGMNQARSQAFAESLGPYELMARFFQPGETAHTEGLLPGLIGAGINLAGMFAMNKGRGGGGGYGGGGGWTPPYNGEPWQPPTWNPEF